MFEFDLEDGVVGCGVGAPFAVLTAEQLFASGCRFLVSITSARRIAALDEPPYVVSFDRALRDEGTSGNNLPPGFGEFVPAPDGDLLARIKQAVRHALRAELGVAVHRGAALTTDAPYRETEAAIAAAAAHGGLAVEMEAAAL